MNRNTETLKKITSELRGLYSLSKETRKNISKAYAYEEYSDTWKANKESEYISTYHNNAYRIIDNINAYINQIDLTSSDNLLSSNEYLIKYLSLINAIGTYNDNNMVSYQIIEDELLSTLKGDFKAIQLVSDKLTSNGYNALKLKNNDVKTATRYLNEIETYLPEVNKNPKSNIMAFHRVEKSISKLADVMGDTDDYSVIPNEDVNEVQDALIGSAISL